MKNILEIQLLSSVKRLLSLMIILFISITGFTQNVGISPTGATAPNANAGLDVNFTTQGLLVPRVALTNSSSFLPLGAAHVAGMIVYNTANVADVTPGLYYSNGTKWVPCIPKANVAGDMQYWNGSSWAILPIGTIGQKLQLNSSGIPVWVP
jgi:hypothetical protein